MDNINNSRFSGFIELIIIIAILATMAAVAIPNFKNAKILKDAHDCIENLKEIAYAKEQWSIDNNAPEGTLLPHDLSEISAYIKGGIKGCPASGAYTYNTVGVDPVCSIGVGLDGMPDTSDDHILTKNKP
jgi:hypothetical protein